MKRFIPIVLIAAFAFILYIPGKAMATHLGTGDAGWSIVWSKHNLAGGFTSNLPVSDLEMLMDTAGAPEPAEHAGQRMISMATAMTMEMTMGTMTMGTMPASVGSPALVMQRVCVFCHTPHGADTELTDVTDSGTAGGEFFNETTVATGISTERPLWNRELSTATYTMYLSPTIDQTPPSAPIGVSRACLSCHDGTVALDALKNWPGSGPEGEGYANNTDVSVMAMRDFEDAMTMGLVGDKFPGNHISNLGLNGLESMLFTVTNPDLSDDHPISIMYGAAGDDEMFWWDGDTRPDYSTLDLAGNAATSGTLSTDVDLYGATGSGAAPVGGTYDFSTLTTYARIWFNEGGPATRDIADDNEILLYNGRVECASCHNVHGTADGVTGHPYATFLRKSNRGSNVCLTCHIK